MITSTTNEKLTQLLNEWYLEIRSRRISNAERLKQEIDFKFTKLKKRDWRRFAGPKSITLLLFTRISI